MTYRFDEFKFDRRAQLRVSELGAFPADGCVDFILRVTPSGESAAGEEIEFCDLLIH